MKKVSGIIILILMMSLFITVSAFAAQNVTVTVNGASVSFPDQQPYIDSNDRTLVPMRAPMEAIGCTVEWNDFLRQAIIKKDTTEVIFTIGSTAYTVNGVTKQMDTIAVITGDRTCIPIRYAAEAVGATVGWDNATRTVGITTTSGTPVNPEPGYYVVRGYTIPVNNDFKEIDTSDTEPTKPVIMISLNGDTLGDYQKQAVQARDVIASKHGKALADEMYNSLMEKEDLYQIINWKKVTPDDLYKVEAYVCSGYAANIYVYQNL